MKYRARRLCDQRLDDAVSLRIGVECSQCDARLLAVQYFIFALAGICVVAGRSL
jgi:hypothetical protein